MSENENVVEETTETGSFKKFVVVVSNEAGIVSWIEVYSKRLSSLARQLNLSKGLFDEERKEQKKEPAKSDFVWLSDLVTKTDSVIAIYEELEDTDKTAEIVVGNVVIPVYRGKGGRLSGKLIELLEDKDDNTFFVYDTLFNIKPAQKYVSGLVQL